MFSGPKAPLTEAVKNYILSLAARPGPSFGPSPSSSSPKPPRWSALESRATGLQPKWNSNFQLIPDGLNDPWLHLATAKTLAHPAMDDTCIHSDIQDNMEYASSAQMGLVHDRIQAVKWLRDQVRSLEDATKQARDSACKGFQTRNSPLNHSGH